MTHRQDGFEKSGLAEEIEGRFPEYAELVNPKPATVEVARASLSPGEALVATYVGAERTFVWAVPREGAIAFAAAEVGRADIDEVVALLRASLEPNAGPWATSRRSTWRWRTGFTGRCWSR